MTAENRALLNDVHVLVRYVEMEIRSYTLPSKAAHRLSRSVSAIPERLALVLAADERVKRTWKSRKAQRRKAR